jgi:hypothetical protein
VPQQQRAGDGERAGEPSRGDPDYLHPDHDGTLGQPVGGHASDQHAHEQPGARGGGDEGQLGRATVQCDDLVHDRDEPQAAREERGCHRRRQQPVLAMGERAQRTGKPARSGFGV